MVYAISDIHGHYDAFIELLNKIKFNDNDILYIVGDAIDRGPKSLELLEYIFEHSNIILFSGNHEELMYTWLETMSMNDTAWFSNGGDTVWPQIKDKSPEYLITLKNKLAALPKHAVVTVGTRTFSLGHACVADLSDSGLTLWGKHYENWGINLGTNHYGVVGHTETYRMSSPNKIFKKDNIFFIDCGACFGYSLGVLNLTTLKKTYVRTGNKS